MICKRGIDDAAPILCAVVEHARVINRYGEFAQVRNLNTEPELRIDGTVWDGMRRRDFQFHAALVNAAPSIDDAQHGAHGSDRQSNCLKCRDVFHER